VPVLVFVRCVLIEDFVEGKDGGVIDGVADEPTIAERTTNSSCIGDAPLHVVVVAGTIEDGSDFFGDAIEVYGRWWGCLTSLQWHL